MLVICGRVLSLQQQGGILMQQRRQKIVEFINREGQITFAMLKEAFPGTSEMTLRTDLKYLDDTGAIVRIHGGAKSLETVAGTDGFLSMRTMRNQNLKQQIARKAVSLLGSSACVFLDSGSTTTLLAHYMPDEVRQIVTSGLSCATEMASLTKPFIQVIGGQLNRYSLSVSGSRSVMELQAYNFDICFLGVTSFHPAIGYCCEGLEDCMLKQAAISRSEYTVALVDSTKFGEKNACCICPPNGVNVVISDDSLPEDQRRLLEEQGVTVI